MKRTALIALSCALVPAAFAQTQSASPAEKPEVKLNHGEAAAGEALYARYCATCHGRTLKGDGPVAKELAKKPIDLTQLAKKNKGVFPFEKVATLIDGRQTSRNHAADMPTWGEIFTIASTDAPNADAAVKQVTHFLWSRQEKPEEKK